MNKRTSNPIAQKSKKWFIDALLKLMKEQPYKEITVKQLSKEAGLDRSTFYRNFDSKQDILLLHLRDISEEYIDKLRPIYQLDMEKQAFIFFEFFNENRSLISLLHQNDLSILLLDTFNHYIPYLHDSTKHKFPTNLSEEYIKFSLAFNAGGMWNVLMKWMEEDFQHSFTDLIHAFNEIATFNYANIQMENNEIDN
ncbi:TetR/AcrR family transcriptional regulator [Siminovitchia fordii]|uniref:AcrR family transcriptional regulator n=1 Tax=Siminovitchia fordii TaxID=254759 RepID=A0ABQ4K4L7_9BACI|nr:TetR/AcrR family transcriptional regulator [Siminovitchia fordii]GIN20576.1 AcrR family transcriptional regulator [Siminovitchia fordii]